MGDANLDNYSDVIIGAPYHDAGSPGSDRGRAYVFSGFDGSVMYTISGAVDQGYLGYSVAGAGDVNLDGNPDFIIGQPSDGSTGNFGRAFVYSGLDGAPLHSLTGAASEDGFGSSVAGIGDITGDSHADFVVGVSRHDDGATTDAGAVSVYNGDTGSVIYSIIGTTASDFLGLGVFLAGDVDGDGTNDFAATNYAGVTSSVRIWSGDDGSLIQTLTGSLGFNYSYSYGDYDGDSKPDLLIGERLHNNASGTAQGAARLYHNDR